MKTAVELKKHDGGERIYRVRSADMGLRDISQRLLAGLIDNEIKSAFIFLTVARTAYQAAKFSDAQSALSKAEAIYVQAAELARDGCGEAHQAIADRLRELRQAIDGLLNGELRQ